jgi:hypothetical protein
MARVLVLNATYEPINVCTLRRAAVLLLKEKAELLEQREGAALHSEHVTLERPDVIRLVNYVRIPREAHRRKITRRAVLARDSWTCQYCGSTKSGLTSTTSSPAPAAASRSGRTSSPPAPPATAARATACRARSKCTRRSAEGAAADRLHPGRQPEDPAPGSSTAAGGLEHRPKRLLGASANPALMNVRLADSARVVACVFAAILVLVARQQRRAARSGVWVQPTSARKAAAFWTPARMRARSRLRCSRVK